MKYLLDTNVCIRFLTGRSLSIADRLSDRNPDEIVLCSVVKAELLFGAAKSNNPKATLDKLLPFCERFASLTFDDDAAETYAKIRAQLERQGTPIGPNDLLIASIALSNQLTLVTHNTNEFNRVSGLDVVDWEE